jgi:hypothetical protein
MKVEWGGGGVMSANPKQCTQGCSDNCDSFQLYIQRGIYNGDKAGK